MFCTKCGKEYAEGDKFCTGCGKNLQENETNQENTVYVGSGNSNPTVDPYAMYNALHRKPASKSDSFSGLAIAGFVLSLVSVFILPFFLGTAGLVFSAVAFNDIKSNGKRGFGLALAGLIIGILNMLINVFYILLTNPQF
jgi:glycerol uptake facilitator-like aquaporin